MSGDIVYVRAGVYYEEVLIEQKSISLIGENPSNTIIDGMTSRIPIEVRRGERVNITGFTLMYSGAHWRSNWLFEHWPESGILLWNSDECTVSGNIFMYNYYGVTIYSSWTESKLNTVKGNVVVNSGTGIALLGHVETGLVYGDNTIIENRILNNGCGISSYLNAGNRIYHNNLINNMVETSLTIETQIWDNGYPSGGNYWSGYAGNDVFSGPHQNVTGSDGIGDERYVIDANNTDNHPLMNPWTELMGDCDGDGDVDYDDFIILAGAYGTSAGQPSYHARADLDNDGDIDYDDFIVLAGNYGKTAV